MVGEKNIIQGQRKVREIYVELGKIDILKISQGKYFFIKGWKKYLESPWSQRYYNLKRNESLLETY